ncbi:MAG: 16S rRNA (cytosine(967)-C(5))-methyltransferase RsmB [Clostridiales bacterium]|nr:16S rRNA (cytosine(967)-C(5))-methyltransferase RsmB [Clostridiales bacterium]
MTKPSQAREIALDVLIEVLERGGQCHVVLRQALEKYQYLDKKDRSLITRVTEGTIENRLAIDEVISRCSSVTIEKMKPLIRTLLRMSVYQILWMDRIPDRAVCNEAVNLAAKRHFTGLRGFVNGVLRRVCRQKESFVFSDWETRYSMPAWLIRLWEEQYDAKTVEGMLQTFLRQPPTSVRYNRSLTDAGAIRQSLERQGVTVKESPLTSSVVLLEGYDSLEELEVFEKGFIQVQDASSCLVGEIAAPQPGSVVLDVCGAPGGKALHLADQMGGSGLVVVRDLTERKIRMVEENVFRAGYSNVRTEVWDARVYDPSWEQRADLVIADLPCSGLGVIGRKPDIKYRVTPERLAELAALQREILTVVSRYVKPGGKLIYSTCTVNRMENEEQREWFLAGFPFDPLPMEESAEILKAEETTREGYIQLIPGRHPCDGFFIAAFRRRDEGSEAL